MDTDDFLAATSLIVIGLFAFWERRQDLNRGRAVGSRFRFEFFADARRDKDPGGFHFLILFKSIAGAYFIGYGMFMFFRAWLKMF